MERLAHAHEHKVAQSRPPFGPERPLRVEHLGDDLAGAQVAREPHLPRGAEHAAHRAARLRAQAGGVAARVGHENRLDGLAVGEAQQELAGESVRAREVVGGTGHVQAVRRLPAGENVPVQPAAQRRQDPRRVGRPEVRQGVAVERPPQGPGMGGVQTGVG